MLLRKNVYLIPLFTYPCEDLYFPVLSVNMHPSLAFSYVLNEGSIIYLLFLIAFTYVPESLLSLLTSNYPFLSLILQNPVFVN